MSIISENLMIDVSFQLKGSAITVVVLALIDYQPESLKQALQEKIDQAPQFFINSPVLISLERLENPAALQDCVALVNICRDLSLLPLGFTSVPDELQQTVRATGLAILPRGGERALKIPEPEPEPAQKAHTPARVETVVEERLVQRQIKVIRRPLRSGQQIEAERADLIGLTHVSEGAVVIADGHIHIYGSLRGRAL